MMSMIFQLVPWCVCVVLVNPTLWGSNVSTKIVIFDLVIFLVPKRKTAYKPY